MEPVNFARNNPEAQIQQAIKVFMRARGWFVKEMGASVYVQGFPDLFCTHSKHGVRLVEVKLPLMFKSKFTPAQLQVFPQLIANGSPIWILTAATQIEYNLLFKKPQGNYHEYLTLKG